MITSLQELNEMVVSISNYVVRQACEHTSSGQRFVSLDDALEQYAQQNPSFTYDDFLAVKDIVLDTIAERTEVLDVGFDEDTEEFDVNCALEFCPRYEWCEGDEDTFDCTYDEWLELPVKQIVDQMSPTRAEEIAQKAIQYANERVGIEALYNFLQDDLGMTDAEIRTFGIREEDYDTALTHAIRAINEPSDRANESIAKRISSAQEKATSVRHAEKSSGREDLCSR